MSTALDFVLTTRVRARYVGCVGHGNLGDEALYSAIKKLFAGCVSFRTTMEEGRILKLLPRRRLYRAVFLGGGTLVKGPGFLQPLRDALRASPQAKIVVFGTGVEDADLWETFGWPTDKDAWCEVLQRSDYLAVRGPLSRMYLRSWGLSKEIHVIGDPTIWFARKGIHPKRRSKRVGVNLGPSRGNIHGQDEGYVLAFGAELLRRLRDTGWQISLFPVVRDDVEYLREAVKIAGIGSLPMHELFLDLAATMDALEQQDVFVGEKLHSVILANCVYTPAIMLEYRTKCRDFMLSIDREDWCYRTDDLDADMVFGRLCELYENLDEHQMHIFTQMQRWKVALRAAADRVNAIVSGDVPRS